MADGVDIVVEDDGAPALVLAGATIVAPGTRSGNDTHEVGSGRFGGKPRRDQQQAAPSRRPGVAGKPQPQTGTVDSPDVIRRRDAVIDAARTLKVLTPDGVRQFVRHRWAGTKVLQESDVTQFALDAQRQRMEDVVDALDYRIRRAVYGRAGGRVVKIEFPRGHLRGDLRAFDANQVISVLDRLRSRGWTEEQVTKHVIRPFQINSPNPPLPKPGAGG